MASYVKFTSVEAYLQGERKSQRRCGIIPYVFRCNRLELCVAKDYKTRDYTDFGGMRHKEETTLEAAFRELEEESAGIFSLPPLRRNIMSEPCIYSNKMLIIFVHLDHFTKDWTLRGIGSRMSSITTAFAQLCESRRRESESYSIHWLRAPHLLRRDLHVYHRVANLIQRSREAMRFLRTGKRVQETLNTALW